MYKECHQNTVTAAINHPPQKKKVSSEIKDS